MFKKVTMMVLVATVLVSGLAVPASAATKAAKARAVREATDKCAQCKMMTPNIAATTQVLLATGKSMMFDDLGCMVKWIKANQSQKVVAEFVRDNTSLVWIEKAKAFYAYDASYKTPMAYGVVSFKTEAAAKKYVAKQGKGIVLSAKQLESHVWKMNMGMMKMNGMESHDHNTDSTMKSGM
jgi:copper chaperone NosL